MTGRLVSLARVAFLARSLHALAQCTYLMLASRGIVAGMCLLQCSLHAGQMVVPKVLPWQRRQGTSCGRHAEHCSVSSTSELNNADTGTPARRRHSAKHHTHLHECCPHGVIIDSKTQNICTAAAKLFMVQEPSATKRIFSPRLIRAHKQPQPVAAAATTAHIRWLPGRSPSSVYICCTAGCKSAHGPAQPDAATPPRMLAAVPAAATSSAVPPPSAASAPAYTQPACLTA